jgi:4-amino-4-deoxy-L-arabinose transferase-like glycosyltransferase
MSVGLRIRLFDGRTTFFFNILTLTKLGKSLQVGEYIIGVKGINGMPGWKTILVAGVIGLIFIGSRLVGITKLPVFADEAIYIRWAQLMNQDFGRYAFFPMQDGKPPLYMWLLRAWLPLFPEDPLLAARLMNVGIGVVSLILIAWFTYLISSSKRAAFLAAGLYTLLPYTFFFDRMGLIDPLITLASALTLVGLALTVSLSAWGWIFMGLGIGGGLMAKTTMVIMIAVIGLLAFYLDRKHRLPAAFLRRVGLGIGIGGLMFMSLRISPSFGALFTRSGDFSFTIGEILSGQLGHIIGNWLTMWRWMGAYVTLPGMGVLLLGAWWWRRNTVPASGVFGSTLLLVFGCLFLLPYAILGKVITARYLLPVVVFLIPSMALIIDRVWTHKRMVAWLVLLSIALASARFNVYLMTDPGRAPFPREEQGHYLTDWASGYGIPEVRDFIRSRAGSLRVVVATEGTFGTLPDGLLMYFDRSPLIANVEIYGIGVPIRSLPPELLEKARVDETYLVVNSHRFLIDPLPSSLELVADYPRPLNGPSLLLFRVNADETSIH